MTKALEKCIRWTFGLMLLLGPLSSAAATDFAIRQVTNFGSPGAGTYAEPIGAANDRLIFLARENGVTGLYSTDGTNVELIDSSVTIFADKVAQLGDELVFAATGPDGRELYATDGHSLRQVADLAPGPLSSGVGSGPNEFMVLNGRLLFHAITDPPSPSGVPARYFHTDGNTIEEFPYSLFSLSGSVFLDDQLVYGGIVPGSGGPLLLHRTDGDSIATIPTPELATPPRIAKVGNYAYFVAGEGAELGVHRTDGTAAELVSLLDTFTTLNRVEHMFEHNGGVVFTMEDRASRELVFFRTGGGTPKEILRWPIPNGVSLTPLEQQPTFSDGEQAYFALRKGLGQELYVFDGDSFDFLASGTGLPFSGFIFSELDGRVFLSSNSPTLQLNELVDGALVPIGDHVGNLVVFHEEILGVTFPLPTPFGAITLWQIKNGELVSLGEVVNGQAGRDQRFVEFRGQLYFAGQVGANRQLFAVVPVPEPMSSLSAGTVWAPFVAIRCRRRQQRRPLGARLQ